MMVPNNMMHPSPGQDNALSLMDSSAVLSEKYRKPTGTQSTITPAGIECTVLRLFGKCNYFTILSYSKCPWVVEGPCYTNEIKYYLFSPDQVLRFQT